jgi:hypothetical protein
MMIAGSTANGYGGGYVSGHDREERRRALAQGRDPRPGEPGDETWITPFEKRWHTGAWGHLTYDAGPRSRLLRNERRRALRPEAQRNAPGATLYGSDTRVCGSS